MQTPSKRRNGEQGSLPHTFYYTALILRQPPAAPVKIHVYSLLNEVIITDQMVMHVVAKVYIPPPEHPGDILMEAMSIAPIPGDPSWEMYDSGLPELPHPFVFGHGHMCGLSTELRDGQALFSLSLSDYVHGATQRLSRPTLCCNSKQHINGIKMYHGQTLCTVGTGAHPQTWVREFWKGLNCMSPRRDCWELEQYSLLP